MDERLIRIGHIFTAYYKQLNPQDLTEDNFKLWIEGLNDPMKTVFNKKGLQGCRGVIAFQRFILELQDNGLEEYLKNELTGEDYTFYKAHSTPLLP